MTDQKYKLVPAQIHISPEAWEVAQMAFGGPGTGEGEPFFDCTAWVGECEDDDGNKTYGLHLSCDECTEEGSVTLAEFPDPSIAAPGTGHDLRAAVVALRQHLALFCGPDDAIAKALFAKADAAIAAAPEPVCRWKPLQGYSGMYFQGCVNDPEKHRARMIHGGDKFCARCGKRIEVEVVSDE